MPEDGSSRGASDAELVRRARRGDDAAFHVLVDRHGGRLYALGLRLAGNAVDAEDVVQDTFVGAFRGLRGFRGHASVKTWLTRILMNRVARLHRSRRRRRAELVGLVIEGMGEAAGGAATAEVRADIRMDVAAVLAGLAEDYRTVIVLRELQHMSYNEIADVLCVPRGTVESRLFRARQKLRELLGDYRP
ncbi:MAG TPA: sigma-70 family RNA polymerase sigma factor [Phycisphaerae bacterium]|nr:sigma-70 family RNA polymerase sigma factor [Phycisphaerae bacterium]